MNWKVAWFGLNVILWIALAVSMPFRSDPFVTIMAVVGCLAVALLCIALAAAFVRKS